MFKIFKSIAGKVEESPMGAISQARASTKDRDGTRLKQADDLFNEGLLLIEQFRLTKDNPDLLIDASEKFEESLKLNRTKGESYFWVAYVLFNFSQVKEALIYLKKAEELKPDYPQIKQLKEVIAKT
jgi:tetratricopeptide (TPR) repeat protein